MRVTEKIRFAMPNARLERLSARKAALNEQITSGRRINRPSDDPLGALRATRITSDERRNEQFARNLDQADTLLRHADGTLQEAANALFRVKELTIRAISSALTDADAQVVADEIGEIREHLRALANTRVEGRYLFGGFETRTEPYDDNFAFQGDTGVQQLEVADGLLVDATVAGGVTFGDGTAATVDVFDNLLDLQTEIVARNEPGMQDQLERLEESIEQVIASQTRIGLELQTVEAGRAIHARLAERLPTDKAALQDADLTAAISELALVDNAFQATLAAGARFFNGSSLLDFLR